MSRALAVVTGANRGLGFEAAKGLALAGLDVAMVVRGAEAGKEAAAKLKEAAPDATFHVVDGFDAGNRDGFAAVVERVRAAAKDQPIKALINNAGIYAYDEDFAANKPGELAAKLVSVNYDSVKGFTTLVVPHLAEGARVVQVGSMLGHARQVFGKDDGTPAAAVRDRWTSSVKTCSDVDAMTQEYVAVLSGGEAEKSGWPLKDPYGVSKLAVMAHTERFAEDAAVQSKSIAVNSMCPGYCKTDMTRGGGFKTPAEGADTMVWLATSADVQGITGKHFTDRKQVDWRTASF
jgi:carbonyl reductase 1